MKKRYLSIVITVVIILVIILVIFLLPKKNQNIEFFVISPNSQFFSCDYNNILIENKTELEQFASINNKELPSKLNKEIDFFKDYTILVEYYTTSSGSFKVVLDDVSFEGNKPKFIVHTERPDGDYVTMDIGENLLVAYVPKRALNGIDLSDWYKPSYINENCTNPYI